MTKFLDYLIGDLIAKLPFWVFALIHIIVNVIAAFFNFNEEESFDVINFINVFHGSVSLVVCFIIMGGYFYGSNDIKMFFPVIAGIILHIILNVVYIITLSIETEEKEHKKAFGKLFWASSTCVLSGLCFLRYIKNKPKVNPPVVEFGKKLLNFGKRKLK